MLSAVLISAMGLIPVGWREASQQSFPLVHNRELKILVKITLYYFGHGNHIAILVHRKVIIPVILKTAAKLGKYINSCILENEGKKLRNIKVNFQ